MKNNITETLVTIALITLAVILLNPFHFWMPDMMHTGMMATALLIFGIFASFVLREKSIDERDDLHRALAGRNAFLAGATIIILGIVVQGYWRSVDTWLVVALTAMIVTKVATRIWSDRNL